MVVQHHWPGGGAGSAHPALGPALARQLSAGLQPQSTSDLLGGKCLLTGTLSAGSQGHQ